MILVLNMWLALNQAHAQVDVLNKECHTQKKGRSCVRLGTTLWQDRSQRQLALRAWEKGCGLKVQAACELLELRADKAAHTVEAAQKPVMKSAENDSINGIARTSPTSFSIRRSIALEFAGDLSGTLQTAKMEAINNSEGDVEGYKFVTIDDGSLFESLGFARGDIITHVNDKPMTSPANATAMLPTLAYQDSYTVKLQRMGKHITHRYNIIQ